MLYRHQEQSSLYSNASSINAAPSTPRAITRACNPYAKTKFRESTTSGITEIVLPHQKGLEIVLPSLAFICRSAAKEEGQGRWLTWFHTHRISKEILQSYDFDLSKVRFVYPKNDEHCYKLFEQALAEGNSHTVVASPGLLSEQQLDTLEKASQVGQCSGLLLRNRIH